MMPKRIKIEIDRKFEAKSHSLSYSFRLRRRLHLRHCSTTEAVAVVAMLVSKALLYLRLNAVDVKNEWKKAMHSHTSR